MNANRLLEIEALGQAVWLDDLSRALIEDGELARLIDEDGLGGVTSNPTIFEKAMTDSDRYDDGFARARDEGLDARETFMRLAIGDVQDACDLLRGVWERTRGQDGYVSFELLPELAHDPEASIEAAREIRRRIDRDNVLIKVPGTAEGVAAFEQLTADGVSVNVTLLFAVSRYEEIAEAYLRGLERRVQRGEAVDHMASVASFFVSRVDGKVDAALEEMGRADLAGRAAVANARIAYESFQRIFAGERWQVLEHRGARVQRPLWASTSTKNPAYPDTLYVDELIGPHTVNTMPGATLAAARDHARPQRTIDQDVEAAHRLIGELREIGVPFDEIVCAELVAEGVEAFAGSFDSLIEAIADKRQRTTA